MTLRMETSVMPTLDDVDAGVCPNCGKIYDALDFEYSDPIACTDGTIIAEAVCPECWVGLEVKGV
jgi:hypothetical protein